MSGGWTAFALLWAWGGCCAYSATTDRRATRILLGLTWPIIFFFLPGFAAWKRKQAQREDPYVRQARQDQKEALYPGCRLGLMDCQSQSCMCIEGRPSRTFVKARADRLRAANLLDGKGPSVRIHVNVQQYMKQMQAAECLMAKVQRHAVDIGCTVIPPDEIVCHTAEQAAQLQAFWETHSCGKKP